MKENVTHGFHKVVLLCELKTKLCSDRVLIPVDPSFPYNQATEARVPLEFVSYYVCHSEEGKERPIAYDSRSLTKAEIIIVS